jgi:hypothetical protein
LGQAIAFAAWGDAIVDRRFERELAAALSGLRGHVGAEVLWKPLVLTSAWW